MSSEPISLSEDLRRLREEGYDISVRSDVGYVVVHDVPYVTSERSVARGILVSKLTLAGNVTTRPEDHVVQFGGEMPSDQHGQPLTKIIIGSAPQLLAEGLEVHHTFSSKPPEGYPDYHAKLTAYIGMLEGPAQAIDPTATARTHPVIEDDDEESVFRYIDNASSNAQIGLITQKLALDRVAIAGLGGTGSYVLDLVAKTHVREIHLFDGDDFLQHNAFRAPAAASVETLRGKPKKVDYFAALYDPMRRGLVPHPEYLDESNVAQLDGMKFVFVCLEGGRSRRIVVEHLEASGVPFVDVGMGVFETNTSLGGVLRVSTSTAENRAAARKHMSFEDGDADDEYDRNIQIADLNCLNATMAVIKWKKLFGFYLDLEGEHNAFYSIDGNHMLNEGQADAS